MELMTATYDTANLRSSLKEGATERLVLLDGVEEHAEYDAANVNTRLARYDHDPSRVDALLSQTVDGTKVYFVTDALGSVYAAVQEDGTVAHKASYDAYGAKTETGATSTPWGYTGRRHDAGTGLQYSRARYYEPTTGRFLAKDRAPRSPGFSAPYGYGEGIPTMLRDPSGHFSIATYTAPPLTATFPQHKDKEFYIERTAPLDDHWGPLNQAIAWVAIGLEMPSCQRAFNQCPNPDVGPGGLWAARKRFDHGTVFYWSNSWMYPETQKLAGASSTLDWSVFYNLASMTSLFELTETLLHELAHITGAKDKEYAAPGTINSDQIAKACAFPANNTLGMWIFR